MTDPNPRSVPADRADRGVSPVVGVVLLVGLTVALAATAGALVGVAGSTPAEPPPTVRVDAAMNASDGWPDGQRLRLVHEAGDVLAVADLAVVVEFPDGGASARLSGFPTRRLAGDTVRGDDVFDRTYAGVDGAADAADGDGEWASGERIEFRVAQRRLDVKPGDGVRVTVAHEPSGATIAEVRTNAQ